MSSLAIKGQPTAPELSLEMDSDYPTVFVTLRSGRRIELGYFSDDGFTVQSMDGDEEEALDGIIATENCAIVVIN